MYRSRDLNNKDQRFSSVPEGSDIDVDRLDTCLDVNVVEGPGIDGKFLQYNNEQGKWIPADAGGDFGVAMTYACYTWSGTSHQVECDTGGYTTYWVAGHGGGPATNQGFLEQQGGATTPYFVTPDNIMQVRLTALLEIDPACTGVSVRCLRYAHTMDFSSGISTPVGTSYEGTVHEAVSTFSEGTGNWALVTGFWNVHAGDVFALDVYQASGNVSDGVRPLIRQFTIEGWGPNAGTGNVPVDIDRLDTCQDVNVAEGAGIDGFALTWDNATGYWVTTDPATWIPNFPSRFVDLTDVAITEGAGINNYVPIWNNSIGKWVAVDTSGWGGGTPVSYPLALNLGGTHADLSATGGAHKVLMQTTAGADITVAQLSLTDMGDTNITSPSDGQTLIYDGATGKWKPGSITVAPALVGARLIGCPGYGGVSATSYETYNGLVYRGTWPYNTWQYSFLVPPGYHYMQMWVEGPVTNGGFIMELTPPAGTVGVGMFGATPSSGGITYTAILPVTPGLYYGPQVSGGIYGIVSTGIQAYGCQIWK